MKTYVRTYMACDNSGNASTLSSGATLTYNSSGECYLSTTRVDLARIEEKDSSSRPYLLFVPGPGVSPAEIEAVDQCPSGNTGYHSYAQGASPGHFTLSFSVPTTEGEEWGWDFHGGLPPKLTIKVRIKRPS